MSDIEVLYLQNIMGQIIGEIHSSGSKEIYNEPISTDSELLGKIEQLEKENDEMKTLIKAKDEVIKTLDNIASNEIRKTKEENAMMREALEFYAKGEIGNDLEVRPDKKELWAIPDKWSQRSMSDHYAGKRAREVLEKLTKGE